MIGELLTVQEVAKELRVSDRTVRALVNSGRLPAFKVNSGDKAARLRFKRADVEQWVQESMVGRR